MRLESTPRFLNNFDMCSLGRTRKCQELTLTLSSMNSIRKQDRRAITNIQLNHKQDAKHIKTLQRDTDVTWFTQMMVYAHKEISSPFITVQKYEGIHPVEKSLHFLFTLSQYLFQYNTIQYHTQSCYNAFFYRGNTMGKF